MKLFVGLFYRAQRSALVAHLETATEYRLDVLTHCGPGLVGALHDLLVLAQPLAARRLEIVTNAADLVKVFAPPPDPITGKKRPICLALPERQGPKGLIALTPKMRQGPTPSGNTLQWWLARDLCRYESWKMLYTPNLPKTEDLWRAHFAT